MDFQEQFLFYSLSLTVDKKGRLIVKEDELQISAKCEKHIPAANWPGRKPALNLPWKSYFSSLGYVASHSARVGTVKNTGKMAVSFRSWMITTKLKQWGGIWKWELNICFFWKQNYFVSLCLSVYKIHTSCTRSDIR